MGGSKESAPTAPQPPTQAQTAADYAAALPVYYQAALQYEPQIAQMEQGIAQSLYPKTVGLQEELAGAAQTGMNASVPSWYQQQTRDAMKSQFGRNLVYNPQAQEQYGIGTQQAAEDWKRYYQNMGLTVSGRQPLTQANNMMSTYTPALATQAAQQQYGTQANIYGTQSQNYWQGQSNPWMNMAGSLAGGIGSGIGTGVGYYTGSKWLGK